MESDALPDPPASTPGAPQPGVPVDPVERRLALDGEAYTLREFMDYYEGDGQTFWHPAPPAPLPGAPQPGVPVDPVERRVALDGEAYTLREFMDFYLSLIHI